MEKIMRKVFILLVLAFVLVSCDDKITDVDEENYSDYEADYSIYRNYDSGETAQTIVLGEFAFFNIPIVSGKKQIIDRNVSGSYGSHDIIRVVFISEQYNLPIATLYLDNGTRIEGSSNTFTFSNSISFRYIMN